MTRLNEAELARLVKAQKRQLLRFREERDEARGIAKTLLKHLRNYTETPPVDTSYYWLLDVEPINDSLGG